MHVHSPNIHQRSTQSNPYNWIYFCCHYHNNIVIFVFFSMQQTMSPLDCVQVFFLNLNNPVYTCKSNLGQIATLLMLIMDCCCESVNQSIWSRTGILKKGQIQVSASLRVVVLTRWSSMCAFKRPALGGERKLTELTLHKQQKYSTLLWRLLCICEYDLDSVCAR